MECSDGTAPSCTSPSKFSNSFNVQLKLNLLFEILPTYSPSMRFKTVYYLFYSFPLCIYCLNLCIPEFNKIIIDSNQAAWKSVQKHYDLSILPSLTLHLIVKKMLQNGKFNYTFTNLNTFQWFPIIYKTKSKWLMITYKSLIIWALSAILLYL